MKFKFNFVELEIRVDDINNASSRIEGSKIHGDGVLDAMFFLLFIRFLEKTNPGAVKMALVAIEPKTSDEATEDSVYDH
jgi:hypothetical protein